MTIIDDLKDIMTPRGIPISTSECGGFFRQDVKIKNGPRCKFMWSVMFEQDIKMHYKNMFASKTKNPSKQEIKEWQEVYQKLEEIDIDELMLKYKDLIEREEPNAREEQWKPIWLNNEMWPYNHPSNKTKELLKFYAKRFFKNVG